PGYPPRDACCSVAGVFRADRSRGSRSRVQPERAVFPPSRARRDGTRRGGRRARGARRLRGAGCRHGRRRRRHGGGRASPDRIGRAAGSTFVYLMPSENVLVSFYPPTGTSTTIGTIMCPDPGTDIPFSMAVDRAGIAYVLFESGHLFRVSTRTAVCVPTKFVPG